MVNYIAKVKETVKASERQQKKEEDKDSEDLKMKMTTADMLIKEELLFTKCLPIIEVLQKNGVPITTTHASPVKAAQLLHTAVQTITDELAMASDSSFVWLRPATDLEDFMDCANKKGLFVTVYGLTLRCGVPLTDTHIKEALQHTFRKVPSLRTCFRKRGDTLWACDMNHEELDFQVTEMKELAPAVESLLHLCFPTTEGPLWCARLLPADAPGRCSRPQLADALPYSRTLLLANHHGIADGTTNMVVTDTFLCVLDNVVTGEPIDDAIQHGKLVAGEESKAILTARVEELMRDEAHFQQLQEDLKKRKIKKKLIPRANPRARDPDFKCQIVLRDLDKETTQRFIKKCKKEGVTVNSGLVAVCDAGIVDFVKDGGLEQDFYSIRGMHTVSMRRYWLGDTSKTLGVHMMPLEIAVSTPTEWRDNFWEYARSVHKVFSQGLQEKDAVMFMASMMGKSTEEDNFAERPPPECDYGAANMGNIDRLIPTEGQQVRLIHLVRFTSCWNAPMHCLFHTLRGCFMYSLTYANDIMTREDAEKLVDKTFDILIAVMQM
ncbi:hypothetical protein GWK47_022133 [Chionoecetes opilio]|uniref:Uncharacterized protein n=1 Tax=Chionoecetes opilio TaxID=41210 RepID=A0A8J5CGB5_CHIOP|nr:hypothetical protein GWK47_022133 [Chionoecetes opilio]